jgi:hypothetical protein
MTPATAWVLYSAVPARMISIRPRGDERWRSQQQAHQKVGVKGSAAAYDARRDALDGMFLVGNGKGRASSHASGPSR